MNYKFLFFLFTIACISLISCGKNATIEIPEVADDPNCIDIGEYFLLSESLERMPYNGKKAIQFVDSLDNILQLAIEEFPINGINRGGTLFRYNVNMQGDTVRYKYKNESKTFLLENDSLKLLFSLRLAARPYSSDPESGTVADVLVVYFDGEVNGIPRSESVLGIVFDQRTWPQNFYGNENFDEISFHKKTYQEVIGCTFRSSLSKVFFNYEFGIISFTDRKGKQWAFDKFLD